jgi:hypothetical protein
VKKIPWLSLGLLLLAYSTFSWFLYSSTAPWLLWLAALIFALLQAVLLTTFSKGFRLFFRRWLRSDIGYFSVILISAFSVTVILVWFNIFEYFLAVVGAEILSRMDLQNAKYNEWEALAILTSISVLGLAVGLIARYVIN